MTDALILKLGSIQQLTVRPTESVLKYTAEGQDLRVAGAELGVDALINGKVQKAGDRVRLTVQLIRTADGAIIWGEKFDEKFTDIFTVQDAISEKISDALALRLTGEQRRGLAKRYTENIEAYQLYLKGRHAWRTFNQSGFLTSINYYNEALKADSNFALAYAGIGDAYSAIGIYGPLSAKESMPKSRMAAQKALSLDESLTEAHLALAVVEIFHDWNWSSAERELKRALELNPNSANAHNLYGYYLQAMGRSGEAVAEMKHAKELAPEWHIHSRDYLLSLHNARRYAEAVEESRHVVKLEPDDYFAYCILGQALTQQGRYDEAAAEFQRALTRGRSRSVRALGAFGYSYAVSGKKREALKLIEELNEKPEPTRPIYVAQIYAGLGDRDQSFATLNAAFDQRYPLLWHVKFNPEFDGLRSDPRYADLLRRMNLPE